MLEVAAPGLSRAAVLSTEAASKRMRMKRNQGYSVWQSFPVSWKRVGQGRGRLCVLVSSDEVG